MDRRAHKRISRYLQRQEREASARIAELDPRGWFDLWHTHLDWNSKANRDGRQVARRLVRLLGQAHERMKSRESAVQVWATVCESTGDSAVYVHSENPNGTPFPHDFGDVMWGQTAAEVREAVSPDHEVGVIRYGSEVVHIVRLKAQHCVAADRAKPRSG